ncbi:hypothetical protein MRB53_039541 [Persea americana]|nr:hypothetical protein MRB53_039541 [Persea americana]
MHGWQMVYVPDGYFLKRVVSGSICWALSHTEPWRVDETTKPPHRRVLEWSHSAAAHSKVIRPRTCGIHTETGPFRCSPEAATQLLCVGAIRQRDPDAVLQEELSGSKFRQHLPSTRTTVSRPMSAMKAIIVISNKSALSTCSSPCMSLMLI